MIAAIGLLGLLAATPHTDLFHEASRAYEQGQYDVAIQQYEQLVRENVIEPAVFYNLGNAYYKAGRIGAAIANYERTLQLDPAHQAARQNLASALQGIRRNLERPSPPEWEASLLFWHYGLSLSAVIWLAILSWSLCWGALALRRWRNVAYMRAAAAGAALLTIIFSASAWAKTHPDPISVASRPVVTARFLPAADEAARFELFEGDRVRVVDEQNRWVLVETATGERGWAPKDEFTIVGPPYLPYVAPAVEDQGGVGGAAHHERNN